jgi:hypothetical protein
MADEDNREDLEEEKGEEEEEELEGEEEEGNEDLEEIAQAEVVEAMDQAAEEAKRQAEPPAWQKTMNWAKAARSWATVISILGATGLGFYAAALKGEPEAEEAKNTADKTWETTQTELNKVIDTTNKQSKLMRRLHQRMVHLQGHQEGWNAAKLHSELTALRKENAELKRPRKRQAEVQSLKLKLLQERLEKQKLVKKKTDALKKAGAPKPSLPALKKVPRKLHDAMQRNGSRKLPLGAKGE